MEGVLESNISSALKAIAEAIKLDTGNKSVEAYWQYLQSVTFIIKCLVQDFSTKGVQQFRITSMTKKFVKLGLQSMERLGAVVENIGVSVVPLNQPDRLAMGRLPTPTDPARIISPHQPESPHSSLGSLRMDLSPIEQAHLRNQYLLSNHKARIAKIASPTDKRVTEMSLTLQRKLIENASIAKARQAAVEKKLLARRRVMEQEAAKRLSSKEDQEFFATVMKYEENAKWPLAWRERVTQNPKDERLITLLVEQILRANDHPITKALLKYQVDIYNKIKPFVDEHMDKVNAISVPFRTDSPTEETADINDNEEEKRLSSLASRSKENSDSDNDIKDLELAVENENDNGDNFSKVAEDIRADLEESAAKGEKVIKQVTRVKTCENSRPVSLTGAMACSNTSDDFDDLFDDEDSCEDSSEIKSSATQETVAAEVGSADDISDGTAAAKHKDVTGDTPAEKSKDTGSAVKHIDKDTNSAEEHFDKGPSSAEKHHEKDSSSDVTGATSAVKHKDKDTKRLSLALLNMDQDLTPLQQSVTKDVHSCLNKLLWLFIIAYEELDTAAGRDNLYVILEDPFFKQIWSHLLLFFRVVNIEREAELAKVMTNMMNACPEDLGIREKFCLMGGVQAYSPAVEEITKIKYFYSPLKKLQCLVNMSRSICQCVEDFYGSSESGKSQGSSLGADDLLPIMSFVVVHSQMPQLFSECSALEEFIHHGYLYGEEGYCLTSVQTALAYLISLKKKKMSGERVQVTP